MSSRSTNFIDLTAESDAESSDSDIEILNGSPPNISVRESSDDRKIKEQKDIALEYKANEVLSIFFRKYNVLSFFLFSNIKSSDTTLIFNKISQTSSLIPKITEADLISFAQEDYNTSSAEDHKTDTESEEELCMIEESDDSSSDSFSDSNIEALDFVSDSETELKLNNKQKIQEKKEQQLLANKVAFEIADEPLTENYPWFERMKEIIVFADGNLNIKLVEKWMKSNPSLADIIPLEKNNIYFACGWLLDRVQWIFPYDKKCLRKANHYFSKYKTPLSRYYIGANFEELENIEWQMEFRFYNNRNGKKRFFTKSYCKQKVRHHSICKKFIHGYSYHQRKINKIHGNHCKCDLYVCKVNEMDYFGSLMCAWKMSEIWRDIKKRSSIQENEQIMECCVYQRLEWLSNAYGMVFECVPGLKEMVNGEIEEVKVSDYGKYFFGEIIKNNHHSPFYLCHEFGSVSLNFLKSEKFKDIRKSLAENSSENCVDDELFEVYGNFKTLGEQAFNMGLILMENEKFEGMVGEVTVDKKADIYLNFGVFYEDIVGDKMRALEMYEMSEKLIPEDETLVYNLNNLKKELGINE